MRPAGPGPASVGVGGPRGRGGGEGGAAGGGGRSRRRLRRSTRSIVGGAGGVAAARLRDRGGGGGKDSEGFLNPNVGVLEGAAGGLREFPLRRWRPERESGALEGF